MAHHTLRPVGNLFSVVVSACLVAACAAPDRPEAPNAPERRPPASAAAAAPAAAHGGAAARPAPARIGTVDAGGLLALREAGGLVLIDVRPAFHFHAGHIGGAVNLPARKFGAWFPAERPRLEAAAAAGRPVVVYCTDMQCPDAGKVAGSLAERGISVSIYPGGWEEWRTVGIEG